MNQKQSLILYPILLISLFSSISYAQGWSQISWGENHHLNSNQKIIKGDFNGNGLDSLMAYSFTGLRYNGLVDLLPNNTPPFYMEWQYTQLGIGFFIRHDNIFLSGDFTGDGKDEILIPELNGDYRTMSFFVNRWLTLSNHTNGNINSTDRYLVGDFDNDNKDEILAIHADGSHYTLKYSNYHWNIIESGNNGQIKWWNLNSSDKYATGDFDGDGKDELLATNHNGWHHTMEFDGSNWQYIEGGNNGFIAQWHMTSGDQFVTGDFDCDGADELFAINSNNGWSHTMRLNSNAWPQWQLLANSNNQGSYLLANWIADHDDWYSAGKFWTNTCDTLLFINGIDWQLTEFTF